MLIQFKLLLTVLVAYVTAEPHFNFFDFETEISFTKYHRYADITRYLAKLSELYPEKISLSSIGLTYEQREMNVVKITNYHNTRPKPAIFIDAGIHAREFIAPASALYLIQQLVEKEDNFHLIDDIEWIIVPNANPDGYEYALTKNSSWQKTKSKGSKCDGVDINRNFDYQWMSEDAFKDECSIKYAGRKAFSEIETRNLRDYVSSLKYLKAYITLHCYGKYIVYPWGYNNKSCDNGDELQWLGDMMKNAIASVRGTQYTVGNSGSVLYLSGGTSDDWAKNMGVDIVFTVELPNGGKHGYPVAFEEILPVSQEVFEAFKVLQDYVRQKYLE